MKLSYWVARCRNDHKCYSIRAKTKKGCMMQVEATGCPGDFEAPKFVEVEYDNGFDLMTLCLGEDGGFWE